MATGSVFETNRTQAVRLPAETRFPAGVKRVTVRVMGQERIIAPVDHSWDTFFESAERPTEDFMAVREHAASDEREAF